MRRVALLLLLLAGLTLPAPLAAQADSAKEQPKPKRNPEVISSLEIEAAGAESQTAHDLVQRLRPLWLRKGRTEVSSAQPPLEPVVYVNDVRNGGPSALAAIPRGSIREIRHLRGTDATQRFGLDHGSGAILVYLK